METVQNWLPKVGWLPCKEIRAMKNRYKNYFFGVSGKAPLLLHTPAHIHPILLIVQMKIM